MDDVMFVHDGPQEWATSLKTRMHKLAFVSNEMQSLLNYVQYSVSQKILHPKVFWQYFPNDWQFYLKFYMPVHTFMSMQTYNVLFN